MAKLDSAALVGGLLFSLARWLSKVSPSLQQRLDFRKVLVSCNAWSA